LVLIAKSLGLAHGSPTRLLLNTLSQEGGVGKFRACAKKPFSKKEKRETGT
jgi:hypothetical protein